MRTFILLPVILMVYLPLSAQEGIDIERLLEQNEITASQGDYEEIVQTLVYLNDHPLRLNHASYDSLKLLVFLSDSQIDNILRFRKTYGGFRYPSELLLVNGISRKDLENILPFIRISGFTASDRKASIKKQMGHEWLVRTRTSRPKQAGYRRYAPEAFLKESDYEKHLENRFQGPPWGNLIKYRFTLSGLLQAGLTLENDPGENYFTRYQQTGFDFISVHLSISPSPFFESIILGDFKLQWGQGLVGWHGFSSGKSSASLNNEKSDRGATPYTSTDENNFLRGVAVSIRPQRDFSLLFFVSRKKSDANIIDRDSLDPDELESASLYQSGYHRSLAECRKKHTLKEFTTGFSARFNHRSFRIGGHLLHYHFSPPLRIGEQVYQQYNDQGRRRTLAGIDYKTGFRHFYLFGETALSEKGAVATVNGLRYSGSSLISASMVYRRYDKKYTSHYSSGFGEYANTSNEEGLYIGLESSPLRNLRINAYYDHFRFFAPRYRATIPGKGNELLTEAGWSSGRFQCSLRYKRESKPEDLKEEGRLRSVRRIREDFRLQFNSNVSAVLELRTRFDHSLYRKATQKEKGFLIYQDVICTFRKPDLKTQFRIAWFNTDSYNSRIYAYEHNVLYGYSFPAYYDKGVRSYININWKPGRKLTLYFKGGMIYYPDREVISSGMTRVEHNKLFDLSLQVRVKL